jgi:hypothetical protein
MSTDLARNYEEFGRTLARRETPTLRFGDDGRYRIDDREMGAADRRGALRL